VTLENKIKAQLKEIYFSRYFDKQNQKASASDFILLVIETIYKLLYGNTNLKGGNPEIVKLVKEGLDNQNTDWNLLADFYEEITQKQSRKRKGQFYTPKYLAEYIADRLIEKIDIIDNPRARILDPSCGGGIFLVKAYQKLKEKIIENIEPINNNHPQLKLTRENVDAFVIGNIYGIDKDPLGVELARLQLYMASGVHTGMQLNIECGDALMLKPLRWGNGEFDVVLGNPPYIGHKRLPKHYRDKLKEYFPGVLVDKADIYCCFINKGIELLRPGGLLGYIVSRYIAEAPGGKGIRQYLMDNGHIYEIIDFYGNRTLNGVQVDPMVFFFRKDGPKGHKKTRVIRIADPGIKGEELFINIKKGKMDGYAAFESPWTGLDAGGWRLMPESYRRIVERIEGQCRYSLGDLVSSFQGIITGCDRAFVVEPQDAQIEGLEGDLLKKWIKNSNICKYRVRQAEKLLIYTDSIEDIDKFPQVKKHVMPYKDRLQKRRECIRGIRKWYELQWGRRADNFERAKIVYPYKSSSNRFAVDYQNHYFSADVYSFYIKEEYEDLITLEFLTGLLNSSLYSFYFKTFGKKLGMDMYEYYPNTVLKLGVKVENVGLIDEAVKRIVHDKTSFEEDIQRELDNIIYDMFGLSRQEIEIIESAIHKDCK
jgi:adenine-specific DNA-methyltransferase